MAFSKKKKRRITVDEKIYYWSATGGDDWISLSVMADVQGGSRLFCDLEYHQIPVKAKDSEFNAVFLTNQFIITPYTVREVIKYALSQNWKPLEEGADLFLGSLDDKIDLRLDINRADFLKNNA